MKIIFQVRHGKHAPGEIHILDIDDAIDLIGAGIAIQYY